MSYYKDVETKIQAVDLEHQGGPREGGLPGAPDDGACLLIKQSFNNILSKDKKRFHVFVNYKEKKSFFIDQCKARYHHMRKGVLAWANLMKKVPNARLIMVSLTYHYNNWEPNDIRAFMLKAKDYLGADLLGYAWVCELQERLVPHYHVLMWITKGAFFPFPDQAGMWTKGSTNITNAKSPFYILTYVGKEKQKNFDQFPRGLRCFAVYISNIGLKLQLRFERLKQWEQGIVKSEGWSELKFWQKMHKSVSGWFYDGSFYSSDEAKDSVGKWEAVFV